MLQYIFYTINFCHKSNVSCFATWSDSIQTFCHNCSEQDQALFATVLKYLSRIDREIKILTYIILIVSSVYGTEQHAGINCSLWGTIKKAKLMILSTFRIFCG